MSLAYRAFDLMRPLSIDNPRLASISDPARSIPWETERARARDVLSDAKRRVKDALDAKAETDRRLEATTRRLELATTRAESEAFRASMDAAEAARAAAARASDDEGEEEEDDRGVVDERRRGLLSYVNPFGRRRAKR